MAHSLSKNWIHLVFSTKHRAPLVDEKLEPKIYAIIKEELEGMNCYLSRINGMPDHIHVLFLLHPSKSLADVVKQLKGVSSYKVNQNDWTDVKFGWQKGYGAFSVSESQLPRLQTYIERQKIHHQHTGFDDEYKKFLDLHGLDDKT